MWQKTRQKICHSNYAQILHAQGMATKSQEANFGTFLPQIQMNLNANTIIW